MTARVYQWRTGNRFELLIDGDNFFPRILAALDQAVEVRLLQQLAQQQLEGQHHACDHNTFHVDCE